MNTNSEYNIIARIVQLAFAPIARFLPTKYDVHNAARGAQTVQILTEEGQISGEDHHVDQEHGQC